MLDSSITQLPMRKCWVRKEVLSLTGRHQQQNQAVQSKLHVYSLQHSLSCWTQIGWLQFLCIKICGASPLFSHFWIIFISSLLLYKNVWMLHRVKYGSNHSFGCLWESWRQWKQSRGFWSLLTVSFCNLQINSFECFILSPHVFTMGRAHTRGDQNYTLMHDRGGKKKKKTTFEFYPISKTCWT